MKDKGWYSGERGAPSAQRLGLLLFPAAGAGIPKAQVLALANAGGDTINTIKAAKEFGIVSP